MIKTLMPFTLFDKRASEAIKEEYKTIKNKVSAVKKFKWVMHFLSVFGSAILFSTIIPMGLDVLASFSHSNLNELNPKMMFKIYFMLGAYFSLNLELASIKLPANAVNFSDWVASAFLGFMQILTMYAGLKFMYVNSHIDKTVLNLINAVKIEIAQKNLLIQSMNKNYLDWSSGKKDIPHELLLIKNNTAQKKIQEERVKNKELGLKSLLDRKDMLKRDFAERHQVNVDEVEGLFPTLWNKVLRKHNELPSAIERAREALHEEQIKLAKLANVKGEATPQEFLNKYKEDIKKEEANRLLMVKKQRGYEKTYQEEKEKVEASVPDKIYWAIGVFIFLAQVFIEMSLSGGRKDLSITRDTILERHKRNSRVKGERDNTEKNEEISPPLEQELSPNADELLSKMVAYYREHNELPSYKKFNEVHSGWADKNKWVSARSELEEVGYIERVNNNTTIPTDKFMELV